MSVAETVNETIASFKILAEPEAAARLNEHLTAARELVNPEWSNEFEQLLLFATGGTLYLTFVPPRFASIHAQTKNIGSGAFVGRSFPNPDIYINLVGAPYKLVVDGEFAALYHGEYLTWSGVGRQFGLDGTYQLHFAHRP